MESEQEIAARKPQDTRRGGLQPIGQILNNLLTREGGKSSNPSPDKPVKETVSEECTCRACGARFSGEVTRYLAMNPPKEVRPTECPQCREPRQAREATERETAREMQRVAVRINWRMTCGMDKELLTKNFANFEQQYQPAAYKEALEWAEGFDLDRPQNYRSLILFSECPGVGKGHLMSAMVNHVLDHWKGDPETRYRAIRFESGPRLVRRIRSTYNLRPGDENHEREDEVYAKLSGAHLLLLDDVGKERPSEFTRETYWYLLDERVNAALPVIISSRLPLEGPNSLVQLMGEDTVDRLYGMSQGKLMKLGGTSYRRRFAVP